MKKAELMEYGIPEEKIRAFNTAYWADVKKAAVRMLEEENGQEGTPSPAAVRSAICAMLRLIHDPARLVVILSNVNRHYHLAQEEQRNGKPSAKDNAQKQPVERQEGASECQ